MSLSKKLIKFGRSLSFSPLEHPHDRFKPKKQSYYHIKITLIFAFNDNSRVEYEMYTTDCKRPLDIVEYNQFEDIDSDDWYYADRECDPEEYCDCFEGISIPYGELLYISYEDIRDCILRDEKHIFSRYEWCVRNCPKRAEYYSQQAATYSWLRKLLLDTIQGLIDKDKNSFKEVIKTPCKPGSLLKALPLDMMREVMSYL